MLGQLVIVLVNVGGQCRLVVWVAGLVWTHNSSGVLPANHGSEQAFKIATRFGLAWRVIASKLKCKVSIATLLTTFVGRRSIFPPKANLTTSQNPCNIGPNWTGKSLLALQPSATGWPPRFAAGHPEGCRDGNIAAARPVRPRADGLQPAWGAWMSPRLEPVMGKQ